MADAPINLRRARKARDRAARRFEADANAARHGRPKTERARLDAEADREARRHEGHRLDGGETGGEPGGEPGR